MFGEINVVRTEKMEIENRGPQLLAVNISLLTVALVAMLLRCYVRIHMVKAFGLDDWLMLLASISFVSYCSFSITGVHYGTGRHKEDLTEESNARAKMFWWCCYLAYCFTMILCKLSIGWFLLRVTVRRLHKWIIYAASVITVITCMAFFFVSIFQCHPVSYFWDKYTQDGTCVNIEVIIGLAYLYSTCSVITDFTFALLPAWIISQLKMKRTTKIALIPLLSMGCVASAAVVVRFAYLPNFRSPDFLWATLDIAIWSTIEQGLGITAGSLATLRPLLKLVGYKLGLTTKPSHMPSYYGKMGGASNQGQGTGSRRRGSQSAHDVLGLDTFPAHNTSVAFTQHEKSFEGTMEAGVIENLAEDKSGDKRRSYWKVKPLHSDSESIEALRAEHSGEGVDDHRKEMRSFWVADNNSK